MDSARSADGCCQTVDPIRGAELADPAKNRNFINDYAYTNEHEFFAVLAEFFFKSPAVLQEKDPEIYEMLRAMFHQDTRKLLQPMSGRRTYREKLSCPCGSGKSYKDCCLANHS